MALFSLHSCAVTPIITSTTCNTDADDKFYFDVFRFPSQSGHDKVFFSATVIVCLADDKSSVCKRECAVCPKKRSVRETLEEIQQTEFYVTAGPFQIRGLDQGLSIKNSCAQLGKLYQVDRINGFIYEPSELVGSSRNAKVKVQVECRFL